MMSFGFGFLGGKLPQNPDEAVDEADNQRQNQNHPDEIAETDRPAVPVRE